MVGTLYKDPSGELPQAWVGHSKHSCASYYEHGWDRYNINHKVHKAVGFIVERDNIIYSFIPDDSRVVWGETYKDLRGRSSVCNYCSKQLDCLTTKNNGAYPEYLDLEVNQISFIDVPESLY